MEDVAAQEHCSDIFLVCLTLIIYLLVLAYPDALIKLSTTMSLLDTAVSAFILVSPAMLLSTESLCGLYGNFAKRLSAIVEAFLEDLLYGN